MTHPVKDIYEAIHTLDTHKSKALVLQRLTRNSQGVYNYGTRQLTHAQAVEVCEALFVLKHDVFIDVSETRVTIS